MKKLILLTFILFLPTALLGQSFIFHSDTLNFQGQPGDLFDQYVDIQNISGQSLNISIIRTQNDLPDSQWISSICTAQLCFPPDVDTVDYASIVGPLPPGSAIDFHLQVYANPNTPGTASVTIKVENQANPSDTAALTFTFSTLQTGIEKSPRTMSGTFQLFANYPNPFNPETNISFEVGGYQSVPTQLIIYNILGQQIAVLVNKVLTPGGYTVTWDGKDSFGKLVASGMYFYQLSAGDIRMMNKMILMK